MTSVTRTSPRNDGIEVIGSSPDWSDLNRIGANYIASSPLAVEVQAATPAEGIVHVAVHATLADVLAAAKGHTIPGGLVIAVDTLEIEAGATVIAGPAEIIARHIVVSGSGPAVVTAPSAQIMTSQITGAVEVTTGGTPVPVTLETGATPQVISISGSPSSASVSTRSVDIADVTHSPWSILEAELSFTAAGVLSEQDDDASLAEATSMLRWVSATSFALTGQRSSFPSVDFTNVASLQASASALLSMTQTAASGAMFVPVLSAQIYEQQVNDLLKVAEVYDTKISDFEARQNLDQLLGGFAQTLSSVGGSAETPLYNTLARLANEAGQVETELRNAALQLQQTQATLAPLQEALNEAIQEQFQRELLEMAIKILVGLAELYVGAAAVLLGDPEILSKAAAEQLKVAADLAEKLIKGGEGLIDSAIGKGAAALGNVPSAADATAAEDGANAMMGSVVSFGESSALLWAVVAQAIAGGKGSINYNPDLAAAVDKLPDLSGFSVGGLDPVAYWDAAVIHVQTAVRPFQSGETAGAANAYLQAMELSATYGRSVGDLQQKLLDLYNQGVAAFDRLRAVHEAEAKWKALEAQLTDDAAKANAAIGFLERGYTAVKRNLVIAVDNYRAAFRYQWLQPSEVRVDTSMNYLELVQAAENSVTSLQQVLAGNGQGVVRPRQNFDKIVYTVRPDDAGVLFQEVNGKGQAHWAVDVGDMVLPDQINGNTAIYLTEATFELEGAPESGEVELQIATSGHYGNQVSDKGFRFVSQGVSMTSDYEGSPPRFITTWKFADEAAYLKPTPYTQWILTVDRGNWQQATSIKMTVSGIFIQNG